MYTYSPSDITVTLAGVKIKGFSSDNVVSISRDNPLYTSKMAMDGSVCVTRQKYSPWKIKLSLAQSSESNDFLNGLVKVVQENDIPIMEYLPLIIKDNSGTSFFFAKDVWIDELPNMDYGQSLNTREWMLTCNDVEYNIGGNSDDLSGVTRLLAGVSAIQTGLSLSNKIVNIARRF